MSSSGWFRRLTLLALMSCHGLATAQYVVVNNGSYIANSGTLYKLNRKSGALKKVAFLPTGGQALQLEAVYYHTEQAATDDGRCVFIFDDGTSDVASFRKSGHGYQRVGRYFNAKLIAGTYAGSLALAPNGQYLYSSYSYSGKIAGWKVNSDCSLVFLASYFDDSSLGPIKVTPNGRYLVNSSGGTYGWAALWRIDAATGELSNLSTVGFDTGVCTRTTVCPAQGVDITADSKLAVFSSYASDYYHQHWIPVALTARITPTGLANPRAWVLKESSDLRMNNFPFLGAAAYDGLGNIYFGILGNGQGYNPGILTAAFTEKPLKFAATNATIVQPQVGSIAITGDLIVVAQDSQQICVFRIQKDGSLKLLSTTVDKQAGGLFSLSIFPNTR